MPTQGPFVIPQGRMGRININQAGVNTFVSILRSRILLILRQGLKKTGWQKIAL